MKLTPKNELEKKAIENKKAIAVVPNNKLKDMLTCRGIATHSSFNKND